MTWMSEWMNDWRNDWMGEWMNENNGIKLIGIATAHKEHARETWHGCMDRGRLFQGGDSATPRWLEWVHEWMTKEMTEWVNEWTKCMELNWLELQPQTKKTLRTCQGDRAGMQGPGRLFQGWDSATPKWLERVNEWMTKEMTEWVNGWTKYIELNWLELQQQTKKTLRKCQGDSAWMHWPGAPFSRRR